MAKEFQKDSPQSAFINKNKTVEITVGTSNIIKKTTQSLLGTQNKEIQNDLKETTEKYKDYFEEDKDLKTSNINPDQNIFQAKVEESRVLKLDVNQGTSYQMKEDCLKPDPECKRQDIKKTHEEEDVNFI